MISLQKNHLLPVRLKPYDEESPRGYLLRLSSANGYTSPSWLIELEPSLRKTKEGEEYIKALERLTGLSAIQSALYGPNGISRISSRYRSKFPRICPMCIKQQGYIDAIWEVVFSCACPHHGILLVENCTKCSAPLAWNRGGIDECGCGAKYSEGRYTEADSDIIYFNSMIWVSAGREVRKVESPGYPDGPLSALTLESLCNCYWYLFMYCGSREKWKRWPKNVADAVKELKGLKSLMAFRPNGLPFYLDRYQVKLKEEKYVSRELKQAFGRLFPDSVYNNRHYEEDLSCLFDLNIGNVVN